MKGTDYFLTKRRSYIRGPCQTELAVMFYFFFIAFFSTCLVLNESASPGTNKLKILWTISFCGHVDIILTYIRMFGQTLLLYGLVFGGGGASHDLPHTPAMLIDLSALISLNRSACR